MKRHWSGCIGLTMIIAGMPSRAQQLNVPHYDRYTYKVVFDNAEPIGGKTVSKITDLDIDDIDDEGDVALRAECIDATVIIWISTLGLLAVSQA